MRKTVKYINTLTAILLMLLMSLQGCIFDNYPQDDGVINVTLSGVTTRSGELFENDGDAIIEKIRIIVLSGNYVEKNQLFEAGDPDYQNPFKVEVVTGPKSIYVIANESGSLSTVLSTVTTKSQLLQIMGNEIDSSNLLDKPLTMSGMANNVNVITGQSNQVTVSVKRLAAKVNLRIRKDTQSDVIINKISLISNTQKTVLWEGENITEIQSYWTYEKNHSYILDGNLQDALTLYVYENVGNNALNKSNATNLVMAGTYAGIDVSYSVYINEHIEGDGTSGSSGEPTSSEVTSTVPAHYYNIKRNHEYNVKATIKSYGITILTEVKDWTPVESTMFAGYGYVVEIIGKDVFVRNGDADCEPHKVELIALGGLKFTGSGTDTEIFEKLKANDSSVFELDSEPSGTGYLEVWYNGAKVHTF